MKALLVSISTGLLLAAGLCAVRAAENLELRDGISFYQDIDVGFPIVAQKMDDFSSDPGKRTFIFFGASGDLNTSRQARRVVDAYQRFKDQPIKFVLIDVDHAAAGQPRDLLKRYYSGYIPCEVIIDSGGKLLWSQNGEVDQKVLQTRLEAALR